MFKQKCPWIFNVFSLQQLLPLISRHPYLGGERLECMCHSLRRSALDVTSRQSSNQMLDFGKVGGASEGNPDTQWLVADVEGGACRRKCLPTGPAVI